MAETIMKFEKIRKAELNPIIKPRHDNELYNEIIALRNDPGGAIFFKTDGSKRSDERTRDRLRASLHHYEELEFFEPGEFVTERCEGGWAIYKRPEGVPIKRDKRTRNALRREAKRRAHVLVSSVGDAVSLPCDGCSDEHLEYEMRPCDRCGKRFGSICIEEHRPECKLTL